MAQVVGKFAAQKLLGKHMKQYADKKVEQGDVSQQYHPVLYYMHHMLIHARL
jgi:hypothetical protein